MQTDLLGLDWNAAWQSAQQAGSMSHRDVTFWNKRAPAFAAHARHKSDYPKQFIDMLQPQQHWHVLDVGCGPGTIAIDLADQVASITALDFSEAMLGILSATCAEKKITNIRAAKACWDDDWQAMGIQPHDVVIASRSLAVDDLRAALSKLNRFATRRVCISAMVGQGPFDRRIVEAAGRPFRPGPDYIYILNLLHRMGIYARLDFTVHPVNRTFADHQDALEECRWMIDDMNLDEQQRLSAFFEKYLVFKNHRWCLPGMPPVRWAVMWWDVE
jgi:SAM-dependent methyltransferase